MSACREGKRKTETTLTSFNDLRGFLGERGVSDWRRPKGGVAEEQRAAGREGVAGGVGLQLGKRAAERGSGSGPSHEARSEVRGPATDPDDQLTKGRPAAKKGTGGATAGKGTHGASEPEAGRLRARRLRAGGRRQRARRYRLSARRGRTVGARSGSEGSAAEGPGTPPVCPTRNKGRWGAILNPAATERDTARIPNSPHLCVCEAIPEPGGHRTGYRRVRGSLGVAGGGTRGGARESEARQTMTVGLRAAGGAGRAALTSPPRCCPRPHPRPRPASPPSPRPGRASAAPSGPTPRASPPPPCRG